MMICEERSYGVERQVAKRPPDGRLMHKDQGPACLALVARAKAMTPEPRRTVVMSGRWDGLDPLGRQVARVI